MENIKVVIADSHPKLRNQLAKQIMQDKNLKLVGVADNGKEAYEFYKSKKPSVILFDLLLTVYDGLTLLDKIKEDSPPTDMKLIMTTSLYNDVLLNEALSNGVDYIIQKPYDTEIIAEKIKKIYFLIGQEMKAGKQEDIVNDKYFQTRQNHDKRLENIISNKLNELGIPARLKGYRYMITAVKEVMSNEDALESVTKVLYPDVAQKHNSTPQRVEKAIRHAIEVAWMSKENNSFKNQFNYLLSTGKIRPTNTEFIAKLSQNIRISS